MYKTYACSDLHGYWNLWEKIKNYIDDTDRIFYLGDALDRGPDGIKLIFDLFRDERVTYIKGNHEDMLAKITTEIINGDFSSLQLWLSNGGTPTINSWMNLSPKDQNMLINIINKLPYCAYYTNKNNKKCFLSHAGTSPQLIQDSPYIDQNLLWDREHFLKSYDFNQKYQNLYIIHGHTPVVHVTKKMGINYPINEIFKYAQGHKIDIDLATDSTKTTCLFDLDFFKPIYFSIV